MLAQTGWRVRRGLPATDLHCSCYLPGKTWKPFEFWGKIIFHNCRSSYCLSSFQYMNMWPPTSVYFSPPQPVTHWTVRSSRWITITMNTFWLCSLSLLMVIFVLWTRGHSTGQRREHIVILSPSGGYQRPRPSAPPQCTSTPPPVCKQSKIPVFSHDKREEGRRLFWLMTSWDMNFQYFFGLCYFERAITIIIQGVKFSYGGLLQRDLETTWALQWAFNVRYLSVVFHMWMGHLDSNVPLYPLNMCVCICVCVCVCSKMLESGYTASTPGGRWYSQHSRLLCIYIH